MADTLYLSLWYPNLRLAGLADKLTAALGAFAEHGGDARVYSATVWPVSWSESPVSQLVYGRRVQGGSVAGPMAVPGSASRALPGAGLSIVPPDAASEGERLPAAVAARIPGAEPRLAVAEALELLHEDYAYEFQIGWSLWELEIQDGKVADSVDPAGGDSQDGKLHLVTGDEARGQARPGARWVRETRLVRVIGYGALFDEGAYEADGHIRIDFGPDTPFLEEGIELDPVASKHVEENVRQLIELTAAVEKASGATARLLWSELGESLAQRLAKRLGVSN